MTLPATPSYGSKLRPGFLHDDADIAKSHVRRLCGLQIGKLKPAHLDAPRCRPEQTYQEPEQRRLAGTGRAEERDSLAFADREVDSP